jgi:acyl carrier protein
MLKRIEEIFSEVTGMTDLNFTEKTRLDKIYNFSSLSMIQLICSIEDEFDIEIPNSQIKKFKTVKDVITFIESQI